MTELEVREVSLPVLDADGSPPPYVQNGLIPTEIDFNRPRMPNYWISQADYELSQTVEFRLTRLDMSPVGLYNMLCLWSQYQSYWYYVLGIPKSTNAEYDYIKKILIFLESKLWDTVQQTQGEKDYEAFKEKLVWNSFVSADGYWSSTIGGFNPFCHRRQQYPVSTLIDFNVAKSCKDEECQDTEDTWYMLEYGKFAQPTAVRKNQTFGIEELRRIQKTLAEARIEASRRQYVARRFPVTRHRPVI